MFYSKVAGADALLIAVNLDPFAAHRSRVRIPLDRLGYAAAERFAVRDLLNGTRALWRGATRVLELDPVRSPIAIFHVEARAAGNDEVPTAAPGEPAGT